MSRPTLFCALRPLEIALLVHALGALSGAYGCRAPSKAPVEPVGVEPVAALVPSTTDTRESGGFGLEGARSAGTIVEEGRAARRIGLHPTHTQSGVVRFPEGTPPEEVCTLVLEVRSREPDALDHPWQELLRRTADDGVPFDLPMPEIPCNVRLHIEAHWLYLNGPVWVGWAGSLPPLELEPRLGCRVSFVLKPPVPSTHDWHQLVGRSLPFSGTWARDRRWGMLPGPSLAVLPDLSLESGILPAGQIVGTFSGLAPFLLRGGVVLELRGGEDARVEVPLEEGLVLSGRVLDASARPVLDAKVVARIDSAGGDWSSETRSAQDGSFELLGIDPDFSSLWAEKDGLRSTELCGSALGQGLVRRDIRLQLLPER